MRLVLLCSNPFGDLPAAGETVRDAIAVALRDPAVHTPDLGGPGTTEGLPAPSSPH